MNFRLCLLALGLASFARADVTLPAVFSDHMVLQGGRSATVWGWADPDEKIRVSIDEQEQRTRADEAGRWFVHLDPLLPGGPHRLVVKGRNKITIDDVLIGEVWLGAGQSNMALPVESARDFPFERSRANLPSLRMFTVKAASAKTAQGDCRGEWKICSPQTVGDFSATLYFFGREIQASLGTPVGLINSSVGGTRIESWISPEAQGATEDMRHDGVGGLFNGFIAPLTPCTLRGMLWYQGESNAAPADAPRYREQLPQLIADWRAHWAEPELPFAWVQLPNLDNRHFDFVTIREGMRAALQIPNTGMAITIDAGDPDDIHPRDKQTVGSRLSRWALGDVYGFDIPTSGPLFAGQTNFDDRIVLSFTHTDGGLVAPGGSLPGFWIAGTNRIWYYADAWIEGDNVVVACSAVPHPVAVRYAWLNNPPCSLYNGAGLPASPFRTDDWP